MVKANAVSGETDLRWIDARHQIADCLTKHASRKSEEVLQKILSESQWRIAAERLLRSVNLNVRPMVSSAF